MSELKVVIADDSEPIRALLQVVLSRISGVKLAGVAENGSDAIELIEQTAPDVLILDIEMPDKDGIDVLRHLQHHDNRPWIVMFTGSPSILLRETCLKAGASHYVDKSQIQMLIELLRERVAGRLSGSVRSAHAA